MRCEACDRHIPDDALLCPYCATGVLRRLESPSPLEGSLERALPPRQGRVPQRVAIAASFAFLLLSLGCCLVALGVNIYYGRTTLVGWWTDLRSGLTAGVTATPGASTPVSPLPTPSLVPAEAPSEGATAILSGEPITDGLGPQRVLEATADSGAAPPSWRRDWQGPATLMVAG
jgi:hypothetical protein